MEKTERRDISIIRGKRELQVSACMDHFAAFLVIRVLKDGTGPDQACQENHECPSGEAESSCHAFWGPHPPATHGPRAFSLLFSALLIGSR